jgi:hypothetical protein
MRIHRKLQQAKRCRATKVLPEETENDVYCILKSIHYKIHIYIYIYYYYFYNTIKSFSDVNEGR